MTARQISNLRIKDGLLMRSLSGNEQVLKRKRDADAVEGGEGGADEVERGGGGGTTEPPVPIEVAIKRQARQAQLWAESAERLRNGTRRRRLRGWAGLPPDVGLPPRFPSELTLEESRGVLRLDKKTYFQIRDVFFEICQRKGIIKKTTAGPERWAEAKEEFIDRCPHLQGIFRGQMAGQFDPNREPMALDLICMDVTKRMRTAGKCLSLIEAKNILGLTPDETRYVRGVFDEVLKADFFTGKLDVSKEHWEGLKQKWIQQSPKLQREFSGSQEAMLWQRKHRALETVARDVQKRNRDSQTRKTPLCSSTQKPTIPKKPKAAKGTPSRVVVQRSSSQSTTAGMINDPNHKPWMPSQRARQKAASAQDPITDIEALASQALSSSNSSPPITAGYPIDPTLIKAAAQGLPSPPPAAADQQSPASSLPTSPATPIYIRPSPITAFKYPSLPKVWLEMLPEPYTIRNLKFIIGKKVSTLGQLGKIEGLADGRTVEGGGGSSWGIDEDDELEAYIGYVGKEGKKAFVFEVK